MRKLIHALMDHTRPGWRRRNAKQKSVWHFLKLLFFPDFLFVSFLMFYRLSELIFLMIFNATLKQQYGVFVGLPLALPSVGISLIFTNLCLFLIPPAKRAFEFEADGDDELTFSEATTTLFSLTFKYLIPVGFGLSGIAMFIAGS